jgi:hypothetical protein
MSLPSESAAAPSTPATTTPPAIERVFRLRPRRIRSAVWFTATLGAVLLLAAALSWTILFVPHDGPGPYLFASFFTFFGVLLVAIALGHYYAGPRSAVTVGPESITIDNGLWRPRTYPYSQVRGIHQGVEGEVLIALEFGYYHQEDMRYYVERDDLTEFTALVNARAACNR